MNEFGLIFCIAIVIETILEYLKKAIPSLANLTGCIFAISGSLGVLSAIAFNADVFASFGYTSTIPYFGEVITGLLCAGGSNLVYDIIDRIRRITTDILPDEKQ